MKLYDWIVNLIHKKAMQKNQEVIRTRWKIAELQRKLDNAKIKKGEICYNERN